jgi:transcriptional regulator with XRE-family HTH domain
MKLRLRELREDHDLTQEMCAKIAFISKNSYIRYENGERVPTIDTIEKFAIYYNTSIDYIAGLTDKFAPYPRNKNF